MADVKLPKAVPTFQPGSRLINGSDVQALTNLQAGVQVIAAATPGGLKATSVQITAAKVEVTAVATAADGILLPPAYPGLEIMIANGAAATSMRVFAAGDDVINAAATQYDVAGAKQATFWCPKKVGTIGQWYASVGA